MKVWPVPSDGPQLLSATLRVDSGAWHTGALIPKSTFRLLCRCRFSSLAETAARGGVLLKLAGAGGEGGALLLLWGGGSISISLALQNRARLLA